MTMIDTDNNELWDIITTESDKQDSQADTQEGWTAEESNELSNLEDVLFTEAPKQEEKPKSNPDADRERVKQANIQKAKEISIDDYWRINEEELSKFPAWVQNEVRKEFLQWSFESKQAETLNLKEAVRLELEKERDEAKFNEIKASLKVPKSLKDELIKEFKILAKVLPKSEALTKAAKLVGVYETQTIEKAKEEWKRIARTALPKSSSTSSWKRVITQEQLSKMSQEDYNATMYAREEWEVFIK